MVSVVLTVMCSAFNEDVACFQGGPEIGWTIGHHGSVVVVSRRPRHVARKGHELRGVVTRKVRETRLVQTWKAAVCDPSCGHKGAV